MAPLRKRQEPALTKIMGKKARSYTCIDFQRILQTYDRGTGPKSVRTNKQILLGRLAQREKEEGVLLLIGERSSKET